MNTNGGSKNTMADKMKRKKAAIQKELNNIRKQEEKLEQSVQNWEEPQWKETLEKKIPSRTLQTLEQVFGKAFLIIFDKGTPLLEKSYNIESIGEDFEVNDYAARVKGRRKELRKIKQTVQKSGMRDMAITTAEGIGLGIFGIGLPDIVMFVGILLRGIYESALHYGIDYHAPTERILILKMMEAALAKGEEWKQLNKNIDVLLQSTVSYTEDGKIFLGISYDSAEFDGQIKRTANSFAMDMLLLKFVQGIPIIGVLGGMSNPIYYHKIMKYVKLKYQKRYLMKLQWEYEKNGASENEK